MSKFKPLTHEEFMLRFENCNNEYVSVIGKYQGSDLPIKCKCSICGEEFESTPYRILHGAKHIKCARKLASEKRKCNYSDLIERIHKINPDIELLGEYVNFHTKMKFKCICGEICEATPDHLVNGGLCYECGRKRASNNYKRTQEEFEKEVGSKNGNIKIIGKYKSIKDKIDTKCLVCGYEWRPIAEQLVKEVPNGCPKCSGRIITNQEFVNQLKHLHPNLIPLEKYVKSDKKIKFHCLDCDADVYIAPSKLKSGQGCPHCQRSHGEIKVEKCLINSKLDYVPQYRIDNPQNQSSNFYYDYAILNNKNIIALIEYDGIGHFEPVDFAGKGEEWALQNLEKTKFRDGIKNQYCKDNNIPLLRIPYWEYNNIDKLVNEFIIKITI